MMRRDRKKRHAENSVWAGGVDSYCGGKRFPRSGSAVAPPAGHFVPFARIAILNGKLNQCTGRFTDPALLHRADFIWPVFESF